MFFLLYEDLVFNIADFIVLQRSQVLQIRVGSTENRKYRSALNLIKENSVS